VTEQENTPDPEAEVDTEITEKTEQQDETPITKAEALKEADKQEQTAKEAKQEESKDTVQETTSETEIKTTNQSEQVRTTETEFVPKQQKKTPNKVEQKEEITTQQEATLKTAKHDETIESEPQVQVFEKLEPTQVEVNPTKALENNQVRTSINRVYNILEANNNS
jgi:hypothetical protein